MASPPCAVIVGTGAGLGAALARRFGRAGFRIAIAARDRARIEEIGATLAAAGVEARAYATDATREADVARLFTAVTADLGTPDVAIYNASRRHRGPIAETPADAFEDAWRVSCFGGFLVGRAAARAMLARGRGTILFTGATASIKAFPQSHSFAVGKFGLRALAHSMARELGPQGIHVAHVVVDGGIASPARAERLAAGGPDSLLDPDAIAESYYQLHQQPRSAWTEELAVRPWVERF